MLYHLANPETWAMTSQQKYPPSECNAETTKQRGVTNLNDTDMVIEMEISDTANFGEIGMFTVWETFLSYTVSSGDPAFRSIETTQTCSTYRLLFNEETLEW
jgi:hypothetical protein